MRQSHLPVAVGALHGFLALALGAPGQDGTNELALPRSLACAFNRHLTLLVKRPGWMTCLHRWSLGQMDAFRRLLVSSRRKTITSELLLPRSTTAIARASIDRKSTRLNSSH